MGPVASREAVLEAERRGELLLAFDLADRALAEQPDDLWMKHRAVLALAPVDRVSALTDLAESYLKSGKRAEARTEIRAALEIAPTYERSQALLLAIVNAK